ncbi:hypothetical protein AXF42_Ash016806 [Apostasia shenzhenica]|uniref:C2H2-type domain-containing protein n=1 Tax=Apostasia shenzhenica TaxID=1088818 RepID=A0A2I0BAG0_9ASPA|nr:hypothetical protein AXF42_Ash016806 [Apostasia shenzhenica]
MGEARGTRERNKRSQCHKDRQETIKEQGDSAPRRALKSFFTCSHHQTDEELKKKKKMMKKKKSKRIGCSGSLCNLRENSRMMLRPEPPSSALIDSCKKRVSPNCRNGSARSMKAPLTEINGAFPAINSSSSFSSASGSFRGMHLRRLSGCYECHMVINPINGAFRDSSSLRTTICSCSDCGEIFMKQESLELHRTISHAVSELGSEDNSRNIVEIIFQSSWLTKKSPVCKIERILKIQNTKKTIEKFEDYRDCIKSKASKLAKKYPRCTADGNELLRFLCTTFTCSLGLNGSTNLCDSISTCKACTIIRDGLKGDAHGGISTTATSGRAHDLAQISKDEEKRAMLVCRVIAGRVKRGSLDNMEEFDSVVGKSGIYSSLDELFVFSPQAILPCFIVIYKAF